MDIKNKIAYNLCCKKNIDIKNGCFNPIIPVTDIISLMEDYKKVSPPIKNKTKRLERHL